MIWWSFILILNLSFDKLTKNIADTIKDAYRGLDVIN